MNATARRPRLIPGGDLERCRVDVFSSLAQSLRREHMSLDSYFRAAWPIIEPATPLTDTWLTGYLAEHLQAVTDRQILRLAVSIHPRSGKSNFISVLWPTHVWTELTWYRWIFGSYSQELSTLHSLKRRRVIESRWYQERWGKHVQIMPDQDRKSIFENTASGLMFATSASGTVTGGGGDVIVFDDFINPQEAESEAERKAKIEAYGNTWSSRLNDPKRGAMVVAAQRTHTDDLTGHVLKEGGWTHIELPVITEKRTIVIFPFSRTEVVREKGDILDPERHNSETLAKQKRAAGSRAWAAQWLCNPSSDSGNMVKRHFWRFYREDPRQIAANAQVVALSWDFAFKDLDTSSYVVGYPIARIGSKKYLLDEVRDHLDFVATCKALETMSTKWPMATHKFYENAANGPAVKSALDKKVSGLLPVPPIGSKTARMAAALPDIEAGDVLLPYPYDAEGKVIPERQWVLDYIEEMARFPEEPNDRGDATSQGITMINAITIDKIEEPQVEDAPNFLDEDFGGFINV